MSAPSGLPEYVPAEQRSGDLVHRGPVDLAAWVHTRVEPAIEPEIAIIDAHHHLWVRPGDAYGVSDLRDEIDHSGHDVRATVFIECRWQYDQGAAAHLAPVGETRQVANVSRGENGHGICRGIIGFADLTDGARVEEALNAHLAVGDGRFRGVRQRAVWDPHVRPNTPGLRPGLLADEPFRQGIRTLARLGLSFDAWQYYTQLGELAELARAVPDVRIVANHAGGPIGIGPHARAGMDAFIRWKKGIADLAKCSNVVMKLGGLGMLHCGFDFHYGEEAPASEQLSTAWRPYMEHCIDCFGPERCLFESNFPVDKQTCGYGVLWNTFKRIVAAYSVAEKHALFFGTAKTAYRLDV